MKAFVLFAVFVVGIYAKKSWSGAGGTNLWNNAANWNPEGIPTATDDVEINSANVQLSLWYGGVANSLVVSGNGSLVVSGTSLSVGSGGISVTDSASFKIDAGNGTVTVNGTATLSSTTGAQFLSGTLRGDWKVQAKSALNFGGANQLSIYGSLSNQGTVASSVSKVAVTIYGTLTNGFSGTASFIGGSLTVDNLVNDGSLVFNYEVVFVTTSGSGTGKISVKSSVLSGIFNNLVIEDSQSSLSGIVSGLNIGLGQQLSTNNVQVNNVNGGTISAYGDITFTGSVALAKLTYVGGTRPGPIIISATGSIDVISLVYNGEKYLTYAGATPLKVGELEQLAGDVHLSGNWSPEKLHIEGNAITIPSGVTVTSPSSYIAAKVDLSGTFVVPATGRLNSTIGSHWALTDPSQTGKFTNNGIVSIYGSTPVVFDKITYSGNGAIEIDGALDLEESTYAFNAVTLKSAASRITGESVTLSYSGLTGPSVGKVIQFLADDVQSTCTSPCGALAAKKYQSFNLWMRQ
eukprot:NODE_2064_length_1700_cov_148.401395_g1766_i0.p1 GENE.NODE_2064_length_1700_cov_148.401395_g1766_i0~~NODE_2064_length_1700_cov_148.401395_g1766_i0.p1  ORF type:complete len:519 (-),score=118.16 NODE_2064_length_1700_cov_148.401395_g1766_i0:92-1648(-)